MPKTLKDGSHYLLPTEDVPIELTACFDDGSGKTLLFGVNEHVLIEVRKDGALIPLIMHFELAGKTINDLKLHSPAGVAKRE